MNTDLLLIALILSNCVLYFGLGRIWQYRKECRRAGNL